MKAALKAALKPGTNFARIEYVTELPLAAANKRAGNVATKRVVANVQLFDTLKDFNVYERAVKKNAAQHNNNAADVDAFKTQSNYFEHTDCFSIVKHKQNGAEYLYAIFNSVQHTEYTLNGKTCTVNDIAELSTNSAAQKLLNPNNETHNKTYNVTHSIVVRTIKLDNIVSIKCNGMTV